MIIETDDAVDDEDDALQAIGIDDQNFNLLKIHIEKLFLQHWRVEAEKGQNVITFALAQVFISIFIFLAQVENHPDHYHEHLLVANSLTLFASL